MVANKLFGGQPVSPVVDADGVLIHQLESDPTQGYITLRQEKITPDAKSFKSQVRQMNYFGSLELLKSFGLKPGFKVTVDSNGNRSYQHLKGGTNLGGNLRIVESVDERFADRLQPKVAGDSGIILVDKDGKPIYRLTEWDYTGELVDSIIPHANGAEVSAFYSTGESASASAPKSNQVDLEDSIKEVEEEAVEEEEFETLED